MLAATMAIGASSASASGVVSLTLDLLPSVPGVNQFETQFTATLDTPAFPGGPLVLGQSTETVRYEDEPEKTGLRIELDVDVGNRFNPIVNTIRFVGEIGDINHSLNDPPVELSVLAGDDLIATPSGVGSLIRTNGLPRQVNANGFFEASETTFIIAEGVVGIEGSVTVPTGPLSSTTITVEDGSALSFSQDTVATSAQLAAGLVNSVDVSFDRVQNGDDIYTVRVEAPLGDSLTSLSFDQPGFGTFGLDLLVNGTLIGEGEFAASSIGPAPGDYNTDGLVDAADYVVWRDAVGSGFTGADGLGDDTVDDLDYQVWFGGFETAAAAVSAVVVPEPEATAIMLVGFGVTLWHRGAFGSLATSRRRGARHPTRSYEKSPGNRRAPRLCVSSSERFRYATPPPGPGLVKNRA
ncbi:MAG: hypothetical protein AAF596_02880 [Planctomycetota bacterium]